MKVNPYKAWLATTISLAIITIICTVFYIYLYIFSIEHIIQAMQTRPKLVRTTADTMLSLIESFSYNQEYIIRDQPQGIFYTLPDNNLIPEIQNLSYNKILEYKENHNKLKKLLNRYNVLTSEISKIMFDQADASSNFLTLGLDYAQSGYVSELFNMRSLSSDEIRKHIEYETISQAMRNSYQTMLDEIKDQVRRNIEKERDLATVFISFFCVLLGGAYLFILLPIICRVENTVLSCWSFFNTFNLGDMVNV